MKALVLTDYNCFEYTEAPEPDVGPDDVLVKVAACGVCGSDVHGMDGSTGRRVPPLIMGHEASGTVAAVGEAVKDLAEGDRVTFDSTVYCGTCGYCRNGLINLCDRRQVLGVSCGDYRRDGAFAEYVAVPRRIVYPLPDGLPFEHAAMVEPLSVAVHAVYRTPVALNDTAVVVGAGVIGLLLVQVLRAAGCGRILAVDVQADRLDLAQALGADHTLNAGAADAEAAVLDWAGGDGADVAFEAVGVPSTVALAVASLRKGGALALVGNVSATVEFPLQAAVTRQLSVYGSCASCGEYPACLDLMAQGTVNVTPLISAVAPLSEGAEWFGRLHAHEAGLIKVILGP